MTVDPGVIGATLIIMALLGYLLAERSGDVGSNSRRTRRIQQSKRGVSKKSKPKKKLSLSRTKKDAKGTRRSKKTNARLEARK